MSKKLCLATCLFLAALFFPSSPVLAGWSIDLIPPSCGVTFNRTSPQVIGTTIRATVNSADSSGIYWVGLTVTGGTLTEITSSPITERRFNWTTTGLAAGSYTFTPGVRDNAGNMNNPCTNTFILNLNLPAWIQTTGDVHSNTRINTPGGP